MQRCGRPCDNDNDNDRDSDSDRGGGGGREIENDLVN